MKFDIIDKKPKIYNILVVTLIWILYLFLMQMLNHQPHLVSDLIVTSIYWVIVIVMLVRAAIKQIHYNPYSYNTIYYIGFSLFILSTVIGHLVTLAFVLRHPEYANGHIVGHLSGSAQVYAFISIPFLLIFTVALGYSNVALLKHEGIRFHNTLGILAGLTVTAGLLIVIFYTGANISGSEAYVFRHTLISNIFCAIFLYFECMLIGIMITQAIVTRYQPDYNKDVIIVLGCAIRKDGTPTPLLKGRLDAAIAFAKKQKENTGRDVIFITSGGKGSDEIISESECMKNYLLSQGIDPSAIYMEDRSTNTFENMKFSKAIIDQVKPDAKILFSTTNYHVFRSGIFARRVKMRAIGLSAPTKWYFWPNASIREFIGILTKHRLKQALVLTGLILIYGLLTYLSFYGIYLS